MRNFPFFFGTVTMELIHLVGVVTGAMTPCASESSNTPLSLGLNPTVMQRGACCTGETVSCNLILYSPSSWPRPSPKTSGKFDMSSSFVTGERGASTAKTEALPVSGLCIQSLSLYWMMFMAKHDLMPRIGRISMLSTKRQSKRNNLSFLQMRILTRPRTLILESHRQQAMLPCELPYQAFHLWVPSYKYVVVARCTELPCQVGNLIYFVGFWLGDVPNNFHLCVHAFVGFC